MAVFFSVLSFAACGASGGQEPVSLDAGLGRAALDGGVASCTPTGPQLSEAVETPQFWARGPGTRVEKHPVVVLEGLQFCAGRPHRFDGVYASTVSENMLKGADIRCTPVEGGPGTPVEQSLRRSVFSTRNHGNDADGDPRGVGVSWLFTPTDSGEYDCELRGWGQTSAGTETVTVVDGEDTRLSVSGVEDGAGEWRQDRDVYLCQDAPNGDPACARSGVVLAQEPEARFAAAEGAVSIDVYAGVEASICAEGYKECSRGTTGTGAFTIRTRLVATQLLTGTGSTICPSARAHVRDVTTPVAGAGELNHTKIDLDLGGPVPVVGDPSCSRTFAIRVLVDYVRTNPDARNHGGLVEGRIPDGDPTDPEALNRAYTSAMALNNF